MFCFIEKTQVVFSVLAEYGGAHGPFCSDQTLVYNHVVTNIGDAYNSCTGKYITCSHTHGQMCWLIGLSIVDCDQNFLQHQLKEHTNTDVKTPCVFRSIQYTKVNMFIQYL